MVWKPLVGQPVTRADLQAIDALCYEVLERVANIHRENVTETTFRDFINNSFVTTSSDGRVIELKEGGAHTPVTWHNRHEFVALVEQYRLNEFKLQVDAMRRGLATMVPVQLLSLFTAAELERMVCGERNIDVSYLRANTHYRPPVKPTDDHVQMLWKVLEEFNMEQRQAFLRFVWGQSRLPYNPADFTQKFEIMGSRRNTDGTLPVSHTCFFSIELPRYSSAKVMREKLLYAINNCVAIDADHAAQNVDWDDES
jgi:hypothetical protein